MAEGKQQRKEMDVGMSRGRKRDRQKLLEETTEKLWRGFFPFPLQTEQYLHMSEVRGKGVPLQEKILKTKSGPSGTGKGGDGGLCS